MCVRDTVTKFIFPALDLRLRRGRSGHGPQNSQFPVVRAVVRPPVTVSGALRARTTGRPNIDFKPTPEFCLLARDGA